VSLFDNMMYSGKNKQTNSKQTNKKNIKSNVQKSARNDLFEFAEETPPEKPLYDFAGINTNGTLLNDKASGKSKSNEFKEEYAEEISDVSRFGIQSYSKAGVTFEKLSENQAKIKYDGLLAKSGAQSITGVYGFGSNQKWENVSMAELKREADGSFNAVIPIEQGKNINIAFKDPADNWDNNSGMNYTFVN